MGHLLHSNTALCGPSVREECLGGEILSLISSSCSYQTQVWGERTIAQVRKRAAGQLLPTETNRLVSDGIPSIVDPVDVARTGETRLSRPFERVASMTSPLRRRKSIHIV